MVESWAFVDLGDMLLQLDFGIFRGAGIDTSLS